MLRSFLPLYFLGVTTSVGAQSPVAIIPNDAAPFTVKEWLVAGPFPSADIEGDMGREPARHGYSTDYLSSIGGESDARIEPGVVVIANAGPRIVFEPHRWKNDYLDLEDVLGKKTNVCAYLYAELESKIEQTVALHIGTNDAGKVWVDGRLVSSYPGDRAARRSQSTARVDLKPGQRTSLLMKIDQGGGGWGAFLEVYGATAHRRFMDTRLPQRMEIGADSQYLTVGDTLHAFIAEYANGNWFELDVPTQWELEDGGLLKLLDSDTNEVRYNVSEGPERTLTLHARKRVGNKTVKGRLGFLVRRKSEKVFPETKNALAIGTRRELFVDHYLIQKLIDTGLVLHVPREEGEVLRFDKPWEGPFSGYCTIIKDGVTYKAFYRGKPLAEATGSDSEVTCYAESRDGIHWEKPDLGLYEVMGTRENNVILADDSPLSHNFSPFLDTKPNIPATERFKALAGVEESAGLFGFTSEDGIHWRKMGTTPLFTKGAFDSQNVAFWSESEKCYVMYFRVWTRGAYAGIRSISRTTSEDFVRWTEPVRMEFGAAPLEHLYTNQTHPYFRAPHIYLAIAARFMPNRQVLTEEQAAQLNVNVKYFKDCSDTVFMTSRGGNTYDRTFMDSFVRPGIGLQNWVSRSNYPALNVVQTGANEMSIYVSHDNAQPTKHLRRYSMRLDGFSSVKASYAGGEMITKLLTFSGDDLVLNFSTSAAGFIKVEVLDERGDAVPGYELENAKELIGNEIEKAVTWEGVRDLGELKDKPVRLRFVMKAADLYALRFR